MEYKKLAELYNLLESTTLKARKTRILADFFRSTGENDIEKVTLLSMGRVFPEWSSEELGVASQLVIKIISKAYGASPDFIISRWKKLGDLGLVSEELCGKKKQAFLPIKRKALTIDKVFSSLALIPSFSGAGSQDKKITLASELFISAEPLEARYLARTILGELRVGVSDGIIRDAIAKSFFSTILWYSLLQQKGHEGKKKIDRFLSTTEGKSVAVDSKTDGILASKHAQLYKKFRQSNKVRIMNEKELESIDFSMKKSGIDFVVVYDPELGNSLKSKTIGLIEEAHNVTNDFSKVALVALKDGETGLKNLDLEPLKPVKVMLYQKASGIDDAFETVGKPAAFEYKYDGFRLQLHNHNGIIKLFTRRLEDVTEQFPDVAEAVRSAVKSGNYILEAEVVGFDSATGKWLPFQKISRRIKRKYDIKETSEKTPVIVNIFDALKIGDANLLKVPFRERRKKIESIVKEIPGRIVLASQLVTASAEEANSFYLKSLAMGNEGIMAKSLDAPYKPGSRVGYGMKIKPVMETLDLVIVGAEAGEGKRSSWFSSFELACYDPDSDRFLTIGWLGTGIKEKSEEGTSFLELTNMLKPLIIREDGKKVSIKPSVVLEVAYEEIQKSPGYTSGFALRFPRFVSLRTDMPVNETADINKIHKLYAEQRSRQ